MGGRWPSVVIFIWLAPATFAEQSLGVAKDAGGLVAADPAPQTHRASHTRRRRRTAGTAGDGELWVAVEGDAEKGRSHTTGRADRAPRPAMPVTGPPAEEHGAGSNLELLHRLSNVSVLLRDLPASLGQRAVALRTRSGMTLLFGLFLIVIVVIFGFAVLWTVSNSEAHDEHFMKQDHLAQMSGGPQDRFSYPMEGQQPYSYADDRHSLGAPQRGRDYQAPAHPPMPPRTSSGQIMSTKQVLGPTHSSPQYTLGPEAKTMGAPPGRGGLDAMDHPPQQGHTPWSSPPAMDHPAEGPSPDTSMSSGGGSAGAATTENLCPALLVPAGMEFIFAMPEAVEAGRQDAQFDVIDLKGTPLSRVVVSENTGKKRGIFLQTLTRQPLAEVQTEHLYVQPSRTPYICWPSGEQYGYLKRDTATGRYKLKHHTGRKLLTFHGDFHEKAVNVVNSAGKLVCATERCILDFDSRPHYQVRVAPHVDAGLVICSLLAIDKLEGRPTPRPW